MKILFVTGAYPRGSEEQLTRLNGGITLSIPSNTFQWAVIDGLHKNNTEYTVVSYPFLCNYPFHYKHIYTPHLDFVIDGNKVGSMEPYCNVKFLSRQSIETRLYNYANKWIDNNIADDNLVIMTYMPELWFVNPLVELKKKYKQLKIATIITDLPDDMANPFYKFNPVKQRLIEREIKKIKRNYKYIDKFILLTKAMEEKVVESIGKNIVIEGILANHRDVSFDKEPQNIKTILYTGSLGVHTSVNDLVDSFLLTTNQNFRLVICGCGECEGYIKNKSKQDSRIIYKGSVSRDKALQLQREASVVVNPRKPSIPITRFSFPSKTMEYMSSGTPLLGYKLEGIPNEYYDYYFTVDDETVEGLASAINDVLSLPQRELNTMAMRAYDFVVNNKNSEAQIKRMVDFLES